MADQIVVGIMTDQLLCTRVAHVALRHRMGCLSAMPVSCKIQLKLCRLVDSVVLVLVVVVQLPRWRLHCSA